MDHKYVVEGYGYRIRPVTTDDAAYIIEVRQSDPSRSQHIHKISTNLEAEIEWIRRYLARDNEYFFIIENRFTDAPEGNVALFKEDDGSWEWGRWIVNKGSLASIEGAFLIYRFAFEVLKLNEICCRTNAENKPVISFHTAMGTITRAVRKDYFTLEDRKVDACEQYSDKKNFEEVMTPLYMDKISKIYRRMLNVYLGEFTFDHIGVAAKNIEKELTQYQIEGYVSREAPFQDNEQGVRGLFIEKQGGPKLELLQNLNNSDTLNNQLQKRQKMYHRAYYVGNFEKAILFFKKNRARVISEPKISTYFGKRICFLIFPNMDMIELIER